MEFGASDARSGPVRRYFDNAATSFPKPPGVAEAVYRFMTENGAPGRGLYAEARRAGGEIERCRERIARLVGLSSPRHVVFGHNTTDALNLAIKGVVAGVQRRHGRRARIVTSTFEHNSVLRPVNRLVELGLAEWTAVAVDPTSGVLDPADVDRAVRRTGADLVAVNHASNVTGVVQPVGAIGKLCRETGALFVVDGAQSLGHVAVDMEEMGIDLLAFPGHKGLLGPQGTGGLCIRPGVEHRLDTIREGGTGNVSEQQTHPEMLPEKYEAGSHNAAGIAGLSEGVSWLLERGIDAVRAHEAATMRPLVEALERAEETLPGLRPLGPVSVAGRIGVFSFTHETLSPAELSSILEMEYGILSRPGLHCAPLVHEAYGTAPPVGQGACRLSLGPFVGEEDVRAAVGALRAVCHAQRDELVGDGRVRLR
ncbi:MAG: aminotransferase class V-fold PLP-dependent enzyme [Phycisphaeraceae bacterium]|nr:aminotransferase class V-fold PLP-dependent enzyme [Phycisphaeraceae bacterium]